MVKAGELRNIEVLDCKGSLNMNNIGLDSSCISQQFLSILYIQNIHVPNYHSELSVKGVIYKGYK